MSTPTSIDDLVDDDEVLDIIGPPDAEDRARRHQQALAEWDEPVPLSGETVPPFPVDALPAALADFVRARSDFSETPRDLCGVLSLAVAAASVARKFTVEILPGYREPLNLFAVVAMAPGTRKTSEFAAVTAPLVAFERELLERTAPQIAEAGSHARVRAKELAEAESRAAKATGEERVKWNAERQGLAAEVRALTVPAEPRIIMSEATPEAIANGLAEQGGRLAVFSPEGDVFGMLKRYSKDGAPNFEVFLKGHAGDELRVDRRHAPPVTVPSPALTVALAVQPDVLAGLARDRTFRERGLLARFMYAVPVSALGTRTFNVPPVPPAVRVRYAALILWLCHAEAREDPLTLTPDAFNTWQAFALNVERELALGGRFVAFSDWAGKLPGLVGRLAGVLHCVEGAAVGRVPAQVSEATMQAAVEVGWYASAHALAAFGMMGATDSDTDARLLLEWLERQQVSTFTTRDACREYRTLNAERVRAGLKVLSEKGWVRPRIIDNPKTGRPSEVWETYPDLFSQEYAA